MLAFRGRDERSHRGALSFGSPSRRNLRSVNDCAVSSSLRETGGELSRVLLRLQGIGLFTDGHGNGCGHG